MSINNFVPELWSAQLITAFRKTHVFNGLVNRNWEGEIRSVGDTVKIQTPSAIAVGAYSGTVSYETPESTSQALVIDKDRYWAFELDDLDQVQANVSLMATYMQEAAYSLADDVDSDIASLYVDAGAGNLAIDLTASVVDFYSTAVEAGQNLDVQNVPRGARWMVICPMGYAAILRDEKFTHPTQTADGLIRTGEVGQIAGFNVFVSNNLTVSTTRRYMYGTNQAITFAEQLLNTEALRRDTSFKDGVRGRLVYGRKVVRPAALGTIAATFE
jgi:hypothetical protein